MSGFKVTDFTIKNVIPNWNDIFFIRGLSYLSIKTLFSLLPFALDLAFEVVVRFVFV